MAANQVLVGAPITGTGGVLRGALGTALPTDETTTLDPALAKLGYVSEDGLTMSTAKSIDKIRAWGGDAVRTVQTEHDVTFSLAFLETNAEVAKVVYGESNVSATAATAAAGTKLAIQVNGDVLPNGVFVFEMKDGDAKIRVVVPNAQVTEVGDITFVHSDAIRYEVTIEAFPDENDVKAFIYSDDGVKAAA